MEETGEKGIFLGVLTYTNVESEGDDSYACRVCGKGIVSFGIHVIGWIVNPELLKSESAEWRFAATREIFPGDEKILSQENIVDMKDIDNPRKEKTYDGTYETLFDVLYQIRCNLFHGSKETANKDFKLICLAYKILLSLFGKYLRKFEKKVYLR